MGDLNKDIRRFVIPALAELFFFSLLSAVNLAMVGRLGPAALSAVGLSQQPVRLSIALFSAFNIGATAMIARFIGAEDFPRAHTVVVQTLMVTVILGVTISLPFFVFAVPIVRAMGARADSLQQATVYMRYMALGTVFQVISLAVSSLLRGAGDAKGPMMVNIVMNLLNLGFGYLLIFGPGPMPALGVAGAGLGATLAKIAAAFLSLSLLFRRNQAVSLRHGVRFRFDWPILRGIAGIGSASAVEQFVLRGGFFLYTRMIADLGTVPFAAHQIALTISSLSTNLGQALGMASASFTGRHLGAGKPDRAVTYGKRLMVLALILSLVVSFVFLFFGRSLVGLFSNEAQVMTALVPVMLVLAIINPAQNTQLIYGGAIRGAGDTRWPLLVSLIGLIFLRLPLVYLSIHVLHWGLLGAWIATALEKYVALWLLRRRYVDGRWKTLEIRS